MDVMHDMNNTQLEIEQHSNVHKHTFKTSPLFQMIW
jgi:hypothetical protein